MVTGEAWLVYGHVLSINPNLLKVGIQGIQEVMRSSKYMDSILHTSRNVGVQMVY